MKKFYSFSVLTASLIFIAAGCESITEVNNSYEYTIEQKRDCFCGLAGEWIKLYVQADTIAKAIKMSDNSKLSYAQYRSYRTIKDLWNLISKTDTSKYELKIEIDSVNNYPSYIYSNVKPIRNGDTVIVIADADFSYTTRNYIRLN